jgi:hypothetical protein
MHCDTELCASRCSACTAALLSCAPSRCTLQVYLVMYAQYVPLESSACAGTAHVAWLLCLLCCNWVVCRSLVVLQPHITASPWLRSCDFIPCRSVHQRCERCSLVCFWCAAVLPWLLYLVHCLVPASLCRGVCCLALVSTGQLNASLRHRARTPQHLPFKHLFFFPRDMLHVMRDCNPVCATWGVALCRAEPSCNTLCGASSHSQCSTLAAAIHLRVMLSRLVIP